MQIIKLDAIDSTNRYLADLVSKIPLKDYAVVVAQYQSTGQGQRGSNWQSEKGKNLIISILKIYKNRRGCCAKRVSFLSTST